MSHRTALGNNKGGVGKSSATVNLAGGAARRGHRVLVIDLDPQSNSSRRLAVRLGDDSPTVSEAIASAARGCAADTIVRCGWNVEYAERIDVIPAAPDLANRGGELHLLGAVRRLAKAMTGVDDDYDVTLIDCPPDLGHLTQLALATADDVLIVTEPEFDAVESAIRLRDFIEVSREDLGNPGLDVLGYLVNRLRDQLGAHRYQLAGLPDLLGEGLVWEPAVPERTAIKDANDAAGPVEHAGAAGRRVAALYDQLADRYMATIGVPA